MKKEIMELLKSADGVYRINNISYLKRWTRGPLNNNLDCLELRFDNINHANFSIYDTKIRSRDYEGIIKECEELTQAFLLEVSKRLCNNLKAGYRNTTRTTI